MGRLDGKVAVVLGAAAKDNMGQVIARRFADEGASVVVGGRQGDALATLAAELRGKHALCDITNKADVETLAKVATETYGRVDIAVNCTGWGLMAKLLETTEEQIDKLTALQFKGRISFLQTFCALMSSTGGGSIVTISSASVYALLYNHAAYIGTKAVPMRWCAASQNEFGPRGIKINSIAPGLTATPMTERETKLPGLEEAFLKEYPLGRIGTTDDIANAALWLVTDESFLTGQVLQVNGGLTLRRNPNPKEINASMRAASG
jgi:NAD(P)-dependent dehydrogenase (short-subunit alcohol dehydrogenase family)